MAKANKKIEETKKKTYDIRLIKEENDRKYLKKLEKQREAQEAAERNRANMERRMKQSQDVRERRYQMFLNKRRETDEFKQQLTGLKGACVNVRREIQQQNFERKLLIRQQRERGQQKYQDFLVEKRMIALRDKANNKLAHQQEIYTYEQEAEDLEKLEAELLKELEVTQDRERRVFGELKDALMDSSLPLKSRVPPAGGADQVLVASDQEF